MLSDKDLKNSIELHLVSARLAGLKVRADNWALKIGIKETVCAELAVKGRLTVYDTWMSCRSELSGSLSYSLKLNI